MLVDILGVWLLCSVLVAIVFAAVGRSALREDQALGHVRPDPADAGPAPGDVPSPRVDVPAHPL